tara:strand:+ start:1413 stop:2042 length:630 start_codon:yes stop_codon:yes gene_type:complete
MIDGLIGKKINMTTSFDDERGLAVPTTIIKLGPCKVIQVKTMKRDGYESVQIGFDESKRLNSPQIGHQKRSNSSYKILKEVSSSSVDSVEVGQLFDCSIFEVGEKVSVQGISKGKGFAGTVKRYNFKGGPKTHGQSDRHRAPGSIGAGSSPGRVWKGTKMSGHMGLDKVTQKGLKITKIDKENNIIEVKGSVPGSNTNAVIVLKENYAS